MNLLKYIPSQLVFWLSSGIVLAFIFPSNPTVNIYLLGLIFMLVVILIWNEFRAKKRPISFMLALAILFSCLGYLRTNLSKPFVSSTHYSHFIKDVNHLECTLTEEKKNQPTSDSYLAVVDLINGIPSTGNIHMNILKDSTEQKLEIGSRIKLITSLTDIKPPTNPHQFNYRSFLHRKGIFHQVLLTKKELIFLGNSTSFSLWPAKIRKKITKRLAVNGFQGDELAIINALLLGQRTDLSPELVQNYQNAGAIHILAVSGLHVGIILLLLNFILNPLQRLPLGTSIKLGAIIIGLWLFALLAGMSPSIVRAATMFTAVAIGMSNRNGINTSQALLLSLFLLLCFKPAYLAEVGFQLSYSAVFFILWLQPKLEKLWSPAFKVSRYIWQLLTVSLAAQLGVLPLSLFYFHQFPGLFLLSNLLIIPGIGILLITGIAIILLAVFNILPAIIVEVYTDLMKTMNELVTWIGNQDSFVFEQISFNFFALISSYCVLILWVKWMELRRVKCLIWALVACSAFSFNILVVKYGLDKTRWMVFDVYKETLIVFQNGPILQAHASNTNSSRIKRTLNEFVTGDYATLERVEPIKNAYQVDHNLLLIIDSTGIYPMHLPGQAYVLLRNSPSINLERFIQQIHPVQVIVDASNYPSEILHWEKTCKSHNIKFHYTVRDGAFLQQF